MYQTKKASKYRCVTNLPRCQTIFHSSNPDSHLIDFQCCCFSNVVSQCFSMISFQLAYYQASCSSVSSKCPSNMFVLDFFSQHLLSSRFNVMLKKDIYLE